MKKTLSAFCAFLIFFLPQQNIFAQQLNFTCTAVAADADTETQKNISNGDHVLDLGLPTQNSHTKFEFKKDRFSTLTFMNVQISNKNDFIANGKLEVLKNKETALLFKSNDSNGTKLLQLVIDEKAMNTYLHSISSNPDAKFYGRLKFNDHTDTNTANSTLRYFLGITCKLKT
jgi:hypothetical protein